MIRTLSFRIVLAAGLLALAGAPAAMAGKPGGGGGRSGGDTLTLVPLTSTDGTLHYGQELTFQLSTSATNPYVNVRCYQGPAFVYDAWVGYYSGAWFAQSFTLSSSIWQGGAADCTARLVAWSKNGREQTLATLGFHVEP
jgi:hypothetical protein